MEKTIDISQTRVSIGCRVTLEKKKELLIKAKEKGFSSLSQYLEDLILKASTSQDIPDEESLTTLTDLDFEIIGEKVADVLKGNSSNVPEDDEGILDKTLKHLSIITGNSSEKEHQTFIQAIKNKNLEYDDFLKLLIDIEQYGKDIELGLLDNLIDVKFSKENKDLLQKYIDYLVENNYAKNGQYALITCLYLGMEHISGGIFSDEFPGRTEFLEAFEMQNELNLNQDENVEQSE